MKEFIGHSKSVIALKLATLVGAAVAALMASVANAQAGLQDPTRPSDWQAAAVVQGAAAVEKAIRLDSILFSPQRRVAVINGRTLSEGESREGMTLLKVDERRVVIRADGAVKELILPPVSNVRR